MTEGQLDPSNKTQIHGLGRKIDIYNKNIKNIDFVFQEGQFVKGKLNGFGRKFTQDWCEIGWYCNGELHGYGLQGEYEGDKTSKKRVNYEGNYYLNIEESDVIEGTLEQ